MSINPVKKLDQTSAIPCSWPTKLPRDVLHIVFSYLKPQDLCHVSATCKSLRSVEGHASTDSTVWKGIVAKNFPKLFCAMIKKETIFTLWKEGCRFIGQLKRKLKADETSIKTEIIILRGLSGFDGIIPIAYEKMMTAIAEQQAAQIAFVQAFFKKNTGAISDVSTLFEPNLANSDIAQAKAQLTKKTAEFNSAKNEYDALSKRLNELDPIDNTTVKGKLAEVQDSLKPDSLENAAIAANKKPK